MFRARYEPEFRNRVSIFAGNFKTGCPNCSFTILLHVNDRWNRVSKIETGCPKDTQTPLWLILWFRGGGGGGLCPLDQRETQACYPFFRHVLLLSNHIPVFSHCQMIKSTKNDPKASLGGNLVHIYINHAEYLFYLNYFDLIENRNCLSNLQKSFPPTTFLKKHEDPLWKDDYRLWTRDGWSEHTLYITNTCTSSGSNRLVRKPFNQHFHSRLTSKPKVGTFIVHF